MQKNSSTVNIRITLLALSLIFLSACKILQVNETKTIANTPSLGVEWDFTGKINPELLPLVDSVVRKAIDDFNAKNGQLKLHIKGKKDKDFISLDFTRVRKVSAGGKAAGYAVTTIGLIGAPVAMIAAEAGVVIAFWYWPEHEVTSSADLSPNMSAEKYSRGLVGSRAGALFSRNSRQIPKMLNRYYLNLMRAFSIIEAQLIQHGKAQPAGK